MAVGDYNSPYTGAQLDDTIRKITSNEIHSYVRVFTNASGAATVNVNSLPAGPNGLRTGTYDVLYGMNGGVTSLSVSRLILDDLSMNNVGTGHSDGTGATGAVVLGFSYVKFDGGNKDIIALTDQVDIAANSVMADFNLSIYKIYRQDTIA